MSTRSGLMASPQKRILRPKKVIDINSLLPCAFTRPAQFSIKPFASLYNPYSKGCSSLCNHPVKKKGWVSSLFLLNLPSRFFPFRLVPTTQPNPPQRMLKITKSSTSPIMFPKSSSDATQISSTMTLDRSHQHRAAQHLQGLVVAIAMLSAVLILVEDDASHQSRKSATSRRGSRLF